MLMLLLRGPFFEVPLTSPTPLLADEKGVAEKIEPKKN